VGDLEYVAGDRIAWTDSQRASRSSPGRAVAPAERRPVASRTRRERRRRGRRRGRGPFGGHEDRIGRWRGRVRTRRGHVGERRRALGDRNRRALRRARRGGQQRGGADGDGSTRPGHGRTPGTNPRDQPRWRPELCARGVAPDGRLGGSIVNVASVAGLVGMPTLGGYSASKHGVVGLTRSAALEYAEQDVRINAVDSGRRRPTSRRRAATTAASGSCRSSRTRPHRARGFLKGC
jgi:hypothetical protein